MVFDGTKGVRFTYNGKEYKEVIFTACAEDDPDLNGYWFYRLDSDDENLSITLHGKYDEDGDLSTQGIEIKVYDHSTDTEGFVAEIYIYGIGAKENNPTADDEQDILDWAEKYGYEEALRHLVKDIMPTTIYKEQMHQIAVELWEWEH